jgi:hypothetical protein
MTHLQETGQPLDNYALGTQSTCFLTGAFFPSSTFSFVPRTCWHYGFQRAYLLGGNGSGDRYSDDGSRSSVMI